MVAAYSLLLPLAIAEALAHSETKVEQALQKMDERMSAMMQAVHENSRALRMLVTTTEARGSGGAGRQLLTVGASGGAWR